MCKQSIVAMSTTLQTLVASRALDQCWFNVQTVILTLAIHCFLELRFAIEKRAPLLALEGERQLENLFPLMQELSLLWPSIEAVFTRFQGLLNLCRTDLAALYGQQGEPSDSSMERQLLAPEQSEAHDHGTQEDGDDTMFSDFFREWDWAGFKGGLSLNIPFDDFTSYGDLMGGGESGHLGSPEVITDPSTSW